MFRIVIYCDDRKLGKLLHGLTGLARGTPEVTPVVNVEKRGKYLKQATNGSAVEMFADYIKKHKLTEVNSDIGRMFCKSIGRSPEGYNNLFQQSKKAGLLRKTGNTSNVKWSVKK